ncbi:DoxX family protein [Ktedonosporobacter rubrisoli]|uniref:DoxX family protein n=1 Tax=Ktedonosporobacter rubrisoli TaxID=2509675 RepID=A0A4P6JTW5_KTERU|nr:DoxX family protein [Ktedonosporobacter rubrisoli]QBD78750.1 DoxX family protein [Ktedonosporobacter rubrisoli]
MTLALSSGLLLLRLVAGLTIAAHGLQKLIPWAGGPGFSGMKEGLQKQGFKPAALWTGLAVVGELGGGLSLALGFLTPLGAAGIIGAMTIAIFKTHWKAGFWSQKHGYEYALLHLAVALAFGIMGPGSYSLDALFGLTALNTLPLFLVLAALAVIVAGIGVISSRPAPVKATEASSHAS